jgi:hypothetical protein
MSNANVYIIVEGQTEQTFVRDLLAPEMGCQGIFLYPVLIGKPGHKGGNIQFERARGDIGKFLQQRPDTYISTMFDYFRLDPHWPGHSNMQSYPTAMEKAGKIENATLVKITELYPDRNIEERFIPYIEMHEFEALLFSNASTLAREIGVDTGTIKDILDECGEPEEIDDDPDKAPSKRLMSFHKGYRKVAMGKTIAEAIGISTMREKCPHFDCWVTRLEQLGKN